jgi:hypothetical protein
MKKMFQLVNKKEKKRNFFSFLIHFAVLKKKKTNLFFLLEYLNQRLKFEDYLAIGFTYSFLSENINFLRFGKSNNEKLKGIKFNEDKKNEKKYLLSNKLYLTLLEKQYLFNLKKKKSQKFF